MQNRPPASSGVAVDRLWSTAVFCSSVEMRHVPVVIVGGGPVGMVLAISLAGFKIRTMLVNTEPSSRWFPKGSTHNARTMEHYRRLGLARDLRKLGLPTDHPTDVGFFATLNGWELGRISMPSEREKSGLLRTPCRPIKSPNRCFAATRCMSKRICQAHSPR
jgi:hypothetical protein